MIVNVTIVKNNTNRARQRRDIVNKSNIFAAGVAVPLLPPTHSRAGRNYAPNFAFKGRGAPIAIIPSSSFFSSDDPFSEPPSFPPSETIFLRLSSASLAVPITHQRSIMGTWMIFRDWD